MKNLQILAFLLASVATIAGACLTSAAQPSTGGADVDSNEPTKQPDKEKKPNKDKKPDPEKKPITPPPDLFTQAAMMGPQFPTGFNPHMMGDFPGTFVRRTFTFTGVQTTTTTTTIRDSDTGIITTTVTTTKTPTTQTRTIVVPAGGTLGSIKIADNSSPRPVDRVFFTYNFYSNLGGFANPPAGSTNSTQSSQVNTRVFDASVSTSTSTVFPGLPRGGFDLHREVFGFEKTLLDGNASIEFRLPVLQQNSAIDGFSSRDIGDLTIVTKYAFLLDQETGNVFSAGLAITAPTGPSIPSIDGNLHTTWLQPWFGYIWNSDRYFLHAFHSVVVPTDSREVTLLFNDVGVNYWLYRTDADRPLRFVVPMIEAHVTTPLNHRDPNGDVFCPDLVVLTGGVHFGLFRNATLSLGVATPVTGPRVYNVEAFAQLNWRY